MQKSDELKRKASAAFTATSEKPCNSETAKDSSKSREEGELSSSDNYDEVPAGSPTQLTTSNAVRTEPSSVNKNGLASKAGNCLLTGNPSRSVGDPSRTSVQPNPRKSCEKNRGPFVPFVISFSDDDSGSDSGECRQGKTFENTGSTLGLNGNVSRRPPASSIAKPKMLQWTSRNDVTKVMPRKVSLSRTFVPSMTKMNGASSRNGGLSSTEQRTRAGNCSLLNKRLAGQARGGNQNIHVNANRLQDLRQQIAVRKNELKLKAAQQNKERVPGSDRGNNKLNLNNDTVRITNDNSAECLQFEPKEPAKKRLKVGEPCVTQVNFTGQQYMPAVQSNLSSEKFLLEKRGQQGIDEHDLYEGNPLGTMPSSISHVQKQDKKEGHVSNLPSGVKKDTDIIINKSRSGRTTKLADPSTIVANRSSQTSPKRYGNVDLKHPGELKCHYETSSVPNKAICVQNITTDSNLHEGRSLDKTTESTSKDTNQAGCFHDPDRILETPCNASLNNANTCNYLGKINIPGNSNMDIQSLLDNEELLDKELEEAQELRHKCEIQERNALKAYRKAQRALVEANARCSYLYRKRELYSAHFRSLMMENSTLLWSSGPRELIGAGLNSLNNISEVNMHLVPSSSLQVRAGFDSHNQQGHDPNIQSSNGAFQNLFDQQVDGQILASVPLNEHDANTSELQYDKDMENAVSSPSNDLSISADEEEGTFLFNHGQSDLGSRREQEVHEGSRPSANNESERKFSLHSSQDSLLLEASLRSQLFARFGMNGSLNKRATSQGMEPVVEAGTQNDDGGEKLEMHIGNAQYGAEKAQVLNLGDGSISVEDHQSRVSASILCPILRSVFRHMKATHQSIVQLGTRSQQFYSSDICIQKASGVDSDTIKPNIISSKTMGEKVGSCTNNIAVDSFWPICMYELRGKCNNDECSWQHFRDRSCKISNRDSSNRADCQVWDATNLSRGLNCLILSPPTYLVSLDALKADFRQHKSVQVQSVWQKFFSASLVLSSLLPTDLSSDVPFLHGNEARLEVHGSWNRRSPYFCSKNVTMSQLGKHYAGVDETLEMALLNLTHEVDKQKGRIEALKVLAPALEADPTSEVFWIVYLHVYYSNQKSIGKDDMFQFAVEHNAESYELWVMYINSRIQLDDRLVAYDTAITALCQHASSSSSDTMHISQCILDLFLQMMNCLCISGKFGKAIEKIYELYPSTNRSVQSHRLLLSDILTCLTVVDKCVFWVCCVYMVIYRKLPDSVVQRLELQKELLAIEWPSAHLTVDEKQQVVTLMEMAVDSLALYIDNESLESEATLKAAHQFAVNHIRCIAVLEGLECSGTLLDKYTKLYPSCLELILMSACPEEYDTGNTSFVRFEEALRNWLEEVPGVQCVWNQYAECALRHGKSDFVKELMNRWFHSVWKVQYFRYEILDLGDSKNFHDSLESASASGPSSCMSNPSEIDVAFALFNLSLYKVLQNDYTEARLAVDGALKAATAEDYKHFAREHAMFLLTYGSEFTEDITVSRMLNILNGYLADARAFHASEPLSRNFIQSIKKLRVRQLVCNLLSPVSSDFSLVNLVLEAWHGPSLLPQRFGKLKDLVDLVEAVMEVLPSNYRLAISVCKFLCGDYSSREVLSSGTSFWASSLLVTTLCQAVPVPPEYVWVEAADTLHKLTDIQSISESFHKRSLSVYPFSIKLWKSYLNLAGSTGNVNAVIEEARERGIELDSFI